MKDKIKKEKKLNEELAMYYEIILEALENVDQSYYTIPVTYRSEEIVRERVFCYEFYHQLRCLAEKNKKIDIKINGEIDKRGNRDFNGENPDFVFHLPGTMERNSIVIEVKGNAQNDYINKCIKDFTTLKNFLKSHQYKIGIFILYNYNLIEFTETFKEKLKEIFLENEELKEISKRIFVICKKSQKDSTKEKILYDIICEEESIRVV